MLATSWTLLRLQCDIEALVGGSVCELHIRGEGLAQVMNELSNDCFTDAGCISLKHDRLKEGESTQRAEKLRQIIWLRLVGLAKHTQ